MATPHISAEKGDFAKTVLMPGRSAAGKVHRGYLPTRMSAVTGVRGMLAYRHL